MAKIKLSENQKQAILNMRKYPNDMVMFNGFMTGGHGIRIKHNTINALQRMGIVQRGKLTDLGNTIEL